MPGLRCFRCGRPPVFCRPFSVCDKPLKLRAWACNILNICPLTRSIANSKSIRFTNFIVSVSICLFLSMCGLFMWLGFACIINHWEVAGDVMVRFLTVLVVQTRSNLHYTILIINIVICAIVWIIFVLMQYLRLVFCLWFCHRPLINI